MPAVPPGKGWLLGVEAGDDVEPGSCIGQALVRLLYCFGSNDDVAVPRRRAGHGLEHVARRYLELQRVDVRLSVDVVCSLDRAHIPGAEVEERDRSEARSRRRLHLAPGQRAEDGGLHVEAAG